MVALKPMLLAYQILRFFKVLYLMNEEGMMNPAGAFQSTQNHKSVKSQNNCVGSSRFL